MATHESRLGSLITALGTDYKAIMAAIAAVRTTATIGTTSSTGYTLVLGDAGTIVETTAATAVTFTVPPNSSVAFPVGTMIEIVQMGAGQITFTPGVAVTIQSRGAVNKMAGQYGVAYLRKQATNVWVLTGDLVA